MPLKILVCVKRVIDPNIRVNVRSDGTGMNVEGLRATLNPFDEVAVEEAVQRRESGQAAEVVVVSAGVSASRDVIRTALAMGADRGILLELPADPEPLAAAKYLRAIVQKENPDLVLMGRQSTDNDFGLTPPLLAGLLGWPQAVQVSHIKIVEGAIEVACELDTGSEKLSVPLPAVVSVDLRLNTPRYAALPAVMKAKKKPLEIIDPATLGLDGALPARARVIKAALPPARGGGRMLADVASLVDALKNEARVI